MPLALSDHSAFIRGALPGVSRTFSLGISLLADPLRDHVGLAYLLCRVLDTLEDASDVDLGARVSLLRRLVEPMRAIGRGRCDESHEARIREIAGEIESLFETATDPRPDIQLCRNARIVFDAVLAMPMASRQATFLSASEMARGMADTLSVPAVRLDSESDLDQYCYYVAGTVGEMLTALFAADRNGALDSSRHWLDRHAVDFGLGLQMTNVIKDVTEDFARGVVYLPQTVLKVTGADIETLLADPRGQAARIVVGRITGRALGCLDAAYAYTLSVPASERDIRVFCALPLVLALRTLGRAVSELSSFEAGKTPKVSRTEVGDLHAEVESSAASDARLGALIRRERDAVVRALGHDGYGIVPSLAYVATGSNLGDRHRNLDRARELLAKVPGVRVLREAPRTETVPVDCPVGSGAFVNGAIELSTALDLPSLLTVLLETERALGRVRTGNLNEPRLIDLDLVLAGGHTIGWSGTEPSGDGHAPIVPHPRMHLRPFVLEPLAQLAPEMLHPVFGRPVVALLDESR